MADEWASSPLIPLEKIRKNRTIIIHYTPHYLYAPTVPFESKDFYPHSNRIKFVVILRDPLERSLSSYWFHNSHLVNKLQKDIGNKLVHSIYFVVINKDQLMNLLIYPE